MLAVSRTGQTLCLACEVIRSRIPGRRLPVSSVPVRHSSRHLKPQTGFKRIRRVIGEVDKSVEKELERIKKASSKKNILDYYKGTAIKQQSFRNKFGLALLKLEEFQGKGLMLTDVQMEHDESGLKILWSCKSLHQHDIDTISNVFLAKDVAIRQILLDNLGDLPSVKFVYDVRYKENLEMEDKFNIIDKEIGEKVSTELMEKLKSLKIEDQIFAMSREIILKQIHISMEKESGALKPDQEQIQRFKEEYVKMVEHHGAEKKKEMKAGIRKFLANRNSTYN